MCASRLIYGIVAESHCPINLGQSDNRSACAFRPCIHGLPKEKTSKQTRMATSRVTNTPNQRLWIFDLDDTLHDASSQIFPVMNQAMTQYIMQALDIDEADACRLRRHYWRVYGATLKGLTRHHGVNPHHFLHATHHPLAIEEMVSRSRGLRHMLTQLPGRKVVFTNAPIRYALRVLNVLGIVDLFEHIFSVESTQFHPKPSVRGFRCILRRMRVSSRHCVMVEDNRQALKTARRIGIKTVLVSPLLHRPCYVGKRIVHINKLNRIKI